MSRKRTSDDESGKCQLPLRHQVPSHPDWSDVGHVDLLTVVVYFWVFRFLLKHVLANACIAAMFLVKFTRMSCRL